MTFPWKNIEVFILKDNTIHEDLSIGGRHLPTKDLKCPNVPGDSSGFMTILSKKEVYNDYHRSWGMSLVLGFITNTHISANFSIKGKSTKDYDWGWKSTWLTENLNWLMASKSQKSFLSRERLCGDDRNASSMWRTNPDSTMLSRGVSGNVANSSSIYIFPKWVYYIITRIKWDNGFKIPFWVLIIQANVRYFYIFQNDHIGWIF